MREGDREPAEALYRAVVETSAAARDRTVRAVEEIAPLLEADIANQFREDATRGLYPEITAPTPVDRALEAALARTTLNEDARGRLELIEHRLERARRESREELKRAKDRLDGPEGVSDRVEDFLAPRFDGAARAGTSTRDAMEEAFRRRLQEYRRIGEELLPEIERAIAIAGEDGEAP